MDSKSLEDINERVLNGFSENHKNMFCVVGSALLVTIFAYIIYTVYNCKTKKKEKQD